ncbi:DUF6371 domain-containing protein [Hymenobacter jejuensis]|uniref:DUF6371 domain-containing protein n=1 Tax=Hymenobacter jejuensis TaxID=2502781 RepID=A0A5B7ZZU1_9BACT|nr:DUF6371 domain-containing protein [Hymenobacter jejuensis]QDA60003.1 hypothetical protein FHG12_07710 [Hymenobacter jejuensis]
MPKPPAPKPVLSIPLEVVTATLRRYEDNNLGQLLRERFGVGTANALVDRFCLGTCAYWPGATVFWLIDEQGRVRGGQVVQFDETGHTLKHQRPDGSICRHTGWVHTALSQAYQRRGEPLPSWLIEYKEYGEKSPCLFGLPQLTNAPAGQPVALVESAKTAIVTTVYMPEFIWLATMGISYLTPSRLEPLRKRRIVLYPDAGAYERWQTKALELRGLGFNVDVSDELEKIVTEDERQAGYDAADVLLGEWPGYPPDWDE